MINLYFSTLGMAPDQRETFPYQLLLKTKYIFLINTAIFIKTDEIASLIRI